METYICPLCGREASFNAHNDRDWCSITCLNPNCLQPSTGWSTKESVLAKWKKYQPIDLTEKIDPENLFKLPDGTELDLTTTRVGFSPTPELGDGFGEMYFTDRYGIRYDPEGYCSVFLDPDGNRYNGIGDMVHSGQKNHTFDIIQQLMR